MADPIVLDANILKDVARGNQAVADALNRYTKAGTPVYVSRAAYGELVTRAQTPYLGGHYREILNDMRIQIAPSGSMADRVALLADNIQHTPGPNQPGQLREYDRRNDPGKPGDAFVAAQAKAINAQLWTLDKPMKTRAPQFGVKLAPECSIRGMSGTEDPVRARQLLGLNPKTISPNGQVAPTTTVGGLPGSYAIPSGQAAKPKKSGSGGGGGGTGGTTASVGIADNTIPQTGGPSARGVAIGAGIQIGFQGVNFVLNLINDYVQKKKVTEALDRVRPAIAQVRAENPRMGVLLLFYYTQIQAPEESILKPGAVFHYLTWGKGVTRDEANEDAFRNPTLSQGTRNDERKFAQEVWLPPLQKSAITTAKCPFPPVAIGRFDLGSSNKAWFQLVEFNIVGGFDDICEKSIKLLDNADFAILRPPSEVTCYSPYGPQKVSVPLKAARTANGHTITVIDLDPYSPFHAAAAMCFPVDDWAQEVFGAMSATDNCRLLAYTNFSMVRWIRAPNIQLLRFL